MKPKSKVVEYLFKASEFQWEIAPGKRVAAWGFNGQVSGPTIKAQKGDTLVLKLKNNLSEPTIIHSPACSHGRHGGRSKAHSARD